MVLLFLKLDYFNNHLQLTVTFVAPTDLVAQLGRYEREASQLSNNHSRKYIYTPMRYAC